MILDQRQMSCVYLLLKIAKCCHKCPHFAFKRVYNLCLEFWNVFGMFCICQQIRNVSVLDPKNLVTSSRECCVHVFSEENSKPKQSTTTTY